MVMTYMIPTGIILIGLYIDFVKQILSYLGFITRSLMLSGSSLCFF